MSAIPELPADILRKIILYSDHSICEMRRVSELWRDLVEEEYSKLANFPPLDEMLITATSDPGYIVAVDLKINRSLGFVLRNLSKRGYGFALIESSPEDKKFVTIQRCLQLDELLNSKASVLSTAKKIKKVVIKELRGDIAYLPNYFSNIRCEEIVVDEYYLTDEASQALVTLTAAWKPTKLHIDIADHTIPQQTAFLVEIAELVDVIYIEQRNYRDSGYPRYLFGDPRSDYWLDILAEMFAKRVSKIKIKHDNARVLADEENLKNFNEMVSQYRGKRLWLAISAFFGDDAENSSRFAANNTILKVIAGKHKSKKCEITMMHRSRLDEEF